MVQGSHFTTYQHKIGDFQYRHASYCEEVPMLLAYPLYLILAKYPVS